MMNARLVVRILSKEEAQKRKGMGVCSGIEIQKKNRYTELNSSYVQGGYHAEKTKALHN